MIIRKYSVVEDEYVKKALLDIFEECEILGYISVEDYNFCINHYHVYSGFMSDIGLFRFIKKGV